MNYHLAATSMSNKECQEVIDPPCHEVMACMEMKIKFCKIMRPVPKQILGLGIMESKDK